MHMGDEDLWELRELGFITRLPFRVTAAGFRCWPLNTPQMHHRGSNTTNALRAALMQLQGVRLRARASWHGDSASRHNTMSRCKFDTSADGPIVLRSSRTLRTPAALHV